MFDSYYVKFKRNMQSKSHHSLHRLQNALCAELKHLEYRQLSHKKANSSLSLKTPIKDTSKTSLVQSKCVRFGKSSPLDSAKCLQKSKGKTNIAARHIGESRLKKSKQEKLKKKGCTFSKSKHQYWEMSNTSTKCNDSKVDATSENMSELMKKNKQYQQTISKQKDLIKQLENIIDGMC